MRSAAQTTWALILLVTFLIVIPVGFVLIILDTSIREAWAWVYDEILHNRGH